jgi:hypothetical protein
LHILFAADPHIAAWSNIHLDLGARLFFVLDFILQALRADGYAKSAHE